MTTLAMRNVLLYFRDRLGVFFSLLSVLLIIALFVLFLGNFFVYNYSENIDAVNEVVNNWIFAGILGVTTVTTTQGAFVVMVNDKVHHLYKDFYSTPVKRYRIVAGYALGSFIVGTIMSMIIFVVLVAYNAVMGNHVMSVLNMVITTGILLLSVLLNAFMIFFFTMYIKTNQAFGAISTILGTLIGFMMGIYVPMGDLPNSIQSLIRFFPQSHTTMLFRQLFIEGIAENAFSHIPAEDLLEFQEAMGVIYVINGYQLTMMDSVLILAGATVLFFLLSVWRMSRRYV
ncbi:MAG: ABC transporter permease [Defluviitaleaceae bacterium]|nr:ABC transporter permease [Defluviitaleaceae bacterium]